MAYDIMLSPEAAEDLQQLNAHNAHVRATVQAARTTYLRHEPTRTSKSRIKRLRQLRRPQYRLRVDETRVYYDVHGNDVEVLAIIDTSESDAWLARFGEREQESNDETDPTVGSEE
jgi:mRNA-degrading endonuclease RelE of RelBE toxin-antitoxin system